MSGTTLNPASQPFFPSLQASRTDESPNPFANPRGSFASPRASPGLPDLRSVDQAQRGPFFGAIQQPPPRLNTPIFRATFEEHTSSYTPARATEDIAPDQREPFITVDSPPSSASPTRPGDPTYKATRGERPYPQVEGSFIRERSLSGHVETMDENATPPPLSSFALRGPLARQTSLGANSVFPLHRQPSLTTTLSRQPSDNYFTPSPSLHNAPVASNTPQSVPPDQPALASSPVSSVSAPSAASATLPVADKSFDAQAKTSPYLQDILDRVLRTEYAQRDLSREVNNLLTKVNIIVERLEQVVPQRSFAPSPIPGATGPLGPPSHLSVSPPSSMNGPFGLGGPREEGDISKRLDALTNSVQQILMIQQQQQLAPGFPPNGNLNSRDFVPDQVSPNSNGGTPPFGGPLPHRPGQRTPGPPMRAFSTGNLDLPIRPELHTGGPPPNLLNQKRKSIVGNLGRRDSTMTVDSDWGGNSPRDGSPAITKWEHLPIVPELLRSISKYGVGPPNKIQQRALPFLLNGADIIAQAPPTQERIAAYVIPAIHIALSALASKPQNRGPIALIISTTVDQATQAQRMIRDLGGNIGVRSALGVGTGGDVQQEIRLLHQGMPHILCGTPQKLHALFTTQGGLPGNEIRFLVLDEVDQLIARNLHDFVFNIVRLLPAPRSIAGNSTPGVSPNPSGFSPFEAPTSSNSPNPGGSGFSNNSGGGNNRRFPPLVHTPNPNDPPGSQNVTQKRQTALFSNTVPQDVLILANAIQLREPVRVLVRRDGNVTSSEPHTGGTRGLRQYYLYLAFTASNQNGRPSNAGLPNTGLGIIGSGRQMSMTAETEQAKEWKLEALADLFIDVDLGQAIVHVNGLSALDSVVYKLASRGLEAIPLHNEMNAGTKVAALNKFRGGSTMIRQPTTKILVVFDVQVKSPDVFQVPLVVNYDLPKVVEDYAHRVAPAISSNFSRAGVVVNFVTATGGDVEMLRSIECFYKIKCPEVPINLRDVL